MAASGTAPAAGAPPARPTPVIIDTDIGDDIDDAFALAVAISDPRLEVIAVTTAFGDTRSRVLLVRRLLEAMGRTDITVAQGRPTADPTPFTQKAWAGMETNLSPAPDAVTVIRQAVARRPGEITLVELAPMTNVGDLLGRDPAAARGLRQVVLMGGSVHAGYNHPDGAANPTPDAEYNIAQAPQAFAGLLATGVPVVMFPLDSTQVKFDQARLDRLAAQDTPTSRALGDLLAAWRRLNAWGQTVPTLFDAVPVVWLLDPSVCSPTPMRIAVDDKGFTRPVAGPPNARVCLSLEAARTLSIVTGALTSR